MSYTEACSISAATMPAIAFGRDGNGQTGIVEELVWTAPDVKFTPAQAKNEAYWETLVAAKKLIVIGKVKVESQDTEASFAEDADLGLRDLDTNAIRIKRYQLVVCACTHAELLGLDGFNGRLLERTKKGFVNARADEEGNVMGLLTSSLSFGLKTQSITGTPWSYTVIDATFADGKDDDKNPYEYKNGFPFGQISPVWRAEGKVTAVASDEGVLTFTVALTKGCSADPLTDALVGNFKLYDLSGTEIVITSVTEVGETGVYDFTATTAATSVQVGLNPAAAQNIGDSLYVSGLFNVVVS